MILFPGGRLRVPLFRTSGTPLEEQNNCFPSQYLKGGTTLDLAVPYGPNFLCPRPISQRLGFCRLCELSLKSPPRPQCGMNQVEWGQRLKFPTNSKGQWAGHSGGGQHWTKRGRGEGQKQYRPGSQGGNLSSSRIATC